MLNCPASFFLLIPGTLPLFTGSLTGIKNPLAATRGRMPFCRLRTAAQYVRCQKALGTFQKLILHCLAFVKGPVAIFLDSGKVDEDVLPGRALNEAIAFGSVEPLHSSLLFHKCNSFRLIFRLGISAAENFRAKKKVVALPARWLFSATDRLPCRKAPITRRLQQPDRSASSNCCTKTSTRVSPCHTRRGAEHNIQELWFL